QEGAGDPSTRHRRRRRGMSEHPHAMSLDALAAGDAVDTKTRAHVEVCEKCAIYVGNLRSEAARFGDHVDATAFAKGVMVRAAREGRARRARVVWAALPVLAAAAACLFWIGRTPVSGSVEDGRATAATRVARFKGGLVVVAIREREGRQERL